MRLNTAVYLVGLALLCAATPAVAGPVSLRDVLGAPGERSAMDGRRSPAPPVARYVAGDGGEFILDRSRRPALLKFEESAEVWVLYPSVAPRGDIIYRNDIGEPMLRATKLGGLTLFTAQRPGGAPAALAGDADALKPPAPVSAAGLLQRLAQASVRASRVAQHLIAFEATGVTPGAEPIFADAALVAAEGIGRLSRAANGRRALATFRKVRLMPGQKPSVAVQEGVMQVVITPGLGMAGRPSSERVAAAVVAGR